jgi:hypothetical protein
MGGIGHMERVSVTVGRMRMGMSWVRLRVWHYMKQICFENSKKETNKKKTQRTPVIMTETRQNACRNQEQPKF